MLTCYVQFKGSEPVVEFHEKENGRLTRCEPPISLHEFIRKNNNQEIVVEFIDFTPKNLNVEIFNNPEVPILSLNDAAYLAETTYSIAREFFVQNRVLSFKVVTETSPKWATFEDQIEKIKQFSEERQKKKEERARKRADKHGLVSNEIPQACQKTNNNANRLGRVVINRGRSHNGSQGLVEGYAPGNSPKPMYKVGLKGGYKNEYTFRLYVNKALTKRVGERVVFLIDPMRKELVISAPVNHNEEQNSYKLSKNQKGSVYNTKSTAVVRELKRRGLSPALNEWRSVSTNGNKEVTIDLFEVSNKTNPEGVELIK